MINPADAFRGAFIHNEFRMPAKGKKWTNSNPYRSEQSFFEWHEDEDLISESIGYGVEAFPPWRHSSRQIRMDYLMKLKEALHKRQKKFEELIIQEAGKARWEARLESKALAAKIEITLKTFLPVLEMMENLGHINQKQFYRFEPRGLCAVLGPFNFPLHLAHGHIVPALLAGNTIILKPSEHTPTCASLYAEAFQEAGFPPGVLQVLLGGGETGKKLIENKNVRGVFFTGSYKNGRRIMETLLRTRTDLSTIAALELGGKNACIIHKDANLHQAVSESLYSAYATAGQRCTCSSRLFVHRNILGEFRDLFMAKMKELRIGDPSLDETFSGPMIHHSAVDSFLSQLAKSKKEGFTVHQESERLQEKSCLVSPSLYESLQPEKDVQGPLLQEEIFGPHTVLIPYQELEEMKSLHEAAPYGLASSIFSKDRAVFDYGYENLEVGLLNWNRPTVGASSSLPFGGLKKSGNNWPAGIFSYFYCAYPKSSLLSSAQFDKDSLPKNLQHIWESSS